MERITEILVIKSLSQIPSIEIISAIPRSTELKIVFKGDIEKHREAIGASLKKTLNGFVVGIHMHKPEITIRKTITDAEVEQNQLFFEKCAKDYRELANHLMNKIGKNADLDDCQENAIDFEADSPDEIWEKMQIIRDEAKGNIENWNYYMHGLHFCFKNVETNQIIEVSIAHGEEYGVLDPYFFSQYIKSTSEYYPLPVEIYDNYQDGDKIIDKMIKLGKFELIQSYTESEFFPVIANR